MDGNRWSVRERMDRSIVVAPLIETVLLTMEGEKLTGWLVDILKGIVVNQDGLKVERTVDEMGVKFTVTVAEEDRGRVIGKKGQTAQAIRTILRIAGFLADVRASMVVDIPGRKFVPRDEDDDHPKNMRPPYV